MIKPNSYKWIVFLSFIALIFVPKQMPIDFLKWAVIIITGGLCIFFEFASLSTANTRTERRQTRFLMLLTFIMAIVNFLI